MVGELAYIFHAIYKLSYLKKKAVFQISIKCIGSAQRGKKLCTELPGKPANVCKWRGKSLCRM